MQILNNIIIEGSKHKPIGLDVVFEPTGKPKPLVIFVHGFKGFKDWGHFNKMAEVFAEAGFVFTKFNFSYNGTTHQNPTEFGDLEAFGNNNYIIELNDLDLVINWILDNKELSAEIDVENVCMIGHSRGGGIAVLKASEDSRIKKIATWASVSDFINRNKQKTIDTWKEKGVVHTFNMRTGQQMPLFAQFYDTLQANKERLNIIKAARKLAIPFLVIHGTNDEAVSVNDANELHKAVKQSELFIVDGAGHTFGARHPFTEKELPADAQRVVKKTIDFFKA